MVGHNARRQRVLVEDPRRRTAHAAFFLPLMRVCRLEPYAVLGGVCGLSRHFSTTRGVGCPILGRGEDVSHSKPALAAPASFRLGYAGAQPVALPYEAGACAGVGPTDASALGVPRRAPGLQGFFRVFCCG